MRRLFAPALVVATLWVYAPVLHYGFLDYDDALYVTERPEVLAGLSARGLAWAFDNVVVGNWHPLTWLSHMLDVQLFGLHAGFHHAENVALHALCALAVYALLARATGLPARSAFVAALFALHPQRIESVAWIAERKDLLSSLGCLAALGAYGRYTAAPSAARMALVLAAASFGLLAKAMLVTLPLLLLLLDVWPLGRLRSRAELAARLREKGPLALLCGALALLALVAQAHGGAVTTLEALPLGQRVANALVAPLAYLRDALWPARLAVFYPHPRDGLPAWQVAGSALALAALTAGAWHLRRTSPVLWVGWLWFLIMLLPVIGLVQVGAQARADRYTYLPLLGPAVALCWTVADACAGRRLARWLPALACAWLAALAFATRATLAYWRSDEALFERAAAVTPDNAIAYVNWAAQLDDRPAEQRALLDRALALEPRLAAAHYGLGRWLASAGDAQQAELHYRLALRVAPGLARAHNNLGNLLFQSDRVDEAIEHYRLALAAEPGRPSSSHNLALALRARAEALARDGQADAAQDALREAAWLEAASSAPAP